MFTRSVILVAICVVLLSATGFAQCKVDLKIGSKIPAKCLPNKNKSRSYIATAPSQMRPSFELKIDGIKYTIAFDEETRKIKFIHTLDRAFRTVNGLQPGSQVKVTQEQLSGGFGGWYTFAGQTPDGWDIIVGTPSTDDWKEKETKTLIIGGFKKGGN